MRKTFTRLSLWALIFTAFSQTSFAQGEPFNYRVVNLTPPVASRYNLAHPFEIIYGPDDYLYITEKVGRVLRVNPTTGIRQILLDYRANTYFGVTRNGAGAATAIEQQGMLGMALHPNFGKGTGQDSIFVAYSYNSTSIRISRFLYTGGATPTLSNETQLINGLPASNDHSSGRMIIGPDGMIYYTCGDKGNNQFNNRCTEILSQKMPTAANVSAGNYARYSGKILRIGRDGSIPADNPTILGVKSHIFTIGHRNPQGLVWEKAQSNGTAYPTMVVGGKLYSSEQGPRTDDELNILTGGKNYGWPYIAGYLDNVNYSYIIWATSASCAGTSYTENTVPTGALIRQETDSALTNFQPPMSTMYTVCTPLPIAKCDAGGTDWMKYPTVAPSSVDFYSVSAPGAGIPNWYPSLIVTSLRRGVVYRYKLNATMDGVVGDSIPYFRTGNRYRDMAMSNNGTRFYFITDSTGTTSGPSGTGSSTLNNPGHIIEYAYSGTLALHDAPPTANNVRKYNIEVYPNPASKFIMVNFTDGVFVRPTRYQLFDMTGKLVKDDISTSKTFQINVETLRKGVYILKLFNGYNLEIGTEKVLIH